MIKKTFISGLVKIVSPHGKLIGLCVFSIIVSCIYIRNLHLTADDGPYFSYAARWIKGHPERKSIFDDSKTPVVAVSLIPRIIKQLREPDFKAYDFGVADMKKGRYFMLLFSVLLIGYLYCFLQNVLSVKNKVIPVLFFLCDPLIMGYAPVIGSDIASGLFTLAALYYCCRYLEVPNRKYIIGASIATGLGLVNKISFVFVLGILVVFFLVLFFKRKRRPAKEKLSAKEQLFAIEELSEKEELPAKKDWVGFLKTAGGVCLIILFIINAAYYFRGTGFRLRDRQYASKTMNGLSSVPFIRSIPVPLPYPYVQSYDFLERNKEVGGCSSLELSSYDGVFIAGVFSEKKPVPYYYLVCLLYKIPLAVFAICLACLYAYFKKGNPVRLTPVPILILSVGTGMFLVLSFLNHFQTGIRHLLIIYPLLYLFLGAGLDRLLAGSGPGWRVFIASAGLYLFISLAFYFPNLIGYTNELLRDKKQVYRVFCDSNISYNQLIIPDKLIQKDVEYKRAPVDPAVGDFWITADQMHPCGPSYGDSPSPKWIRDFKPIGEYKYSVLLFHISQQDIDGSQPGKQALPTKAYAPFAPLLKK